MENWQSPYYINHLFELDFIHCSYKIAKEKNPAENARPRSAGGSKERASEAGLHITCFDFSSKDHLLLVVGTLCGGLYKCKLDMAVPIEGDNRRRIVITELFHEVLWIN